MSLPEGWRETTLEKLTTISSSKRIFHSEYVTKGIPFYRSKEIIEKQKGNNISTELFITQEKYNEIKDKYSVPIENDLLLTSVGTLGIPYIVKKNEIFYFKDGNLTWFREYNNLEPLFLYYFFLSFTGKERLNEITIGSTQSALTINGLKQISISLPPFQEQKAIANILSSFDEKIELLKEQNETLEEMAQGVFKESLVKYENKNKTTLGGLVKIKYGKDHKHLADGDYPLYGSGGIMRYVEKPLYDKESILIPRKGTLGNLFFIQEAFWSVDTIFYTIIDEEQVSPIYLYYKLKRINLANLDVGSAVPSLTTQVLNALELEVPSIENQKETVALLTSFNNKKLFNNSQIKSLSKTRDTLLPKLMSGELRVEGFGE